MDENLQYIFDKLIEKYYRENTITTFLARFKISPISINTETGIGPLLDSDVTYQATISRDKKYLLLRYMDHDSKYPPFICDIHEILKLDEVEELVKEL